MTHAVHAKSQFRITLDTNTYSVTAELRIGEPVTLRMSSRFISTYAMSSITFNHEEE